MHTNVPQTFSLWDLINFSSPVFQTLHMTTVTPRLDYIYVTSSQIFVSDPIHYEIPTQGIFYIILHRTSPWPPPTKVKISSEPGSTSAITSIAAWGTRRRSQYQSTGSQSQEVMIVRNLSHNQSSLCQKMDFPFRANNRQRPPWL